MILPENAPDPAKKGGGGAAARKRRAELFVQQPAFRQRRAGRRLGVGNRLWAADFFGFYPMERRAGIGTVNIRACAGLLSCSAVRGGAWASAGTA